MRRAQRNIENPHGAAAVGERLRLTREALEYTQAFIAQLVGMSPQAWNNNERGDDRMGLNTALRLVQALGHHGVDLNWIYSGRMELMSPQLREKILRLQARRGGTHRAAAGTRQPASA